MSKALASFSMSDSGKMRTSSSYEQYSKSVKGMWVILFLGSVIFFKDLHELNAACSIVTIVFGSFFVVNAMHVQKAR